MDNEIKKIIDKEEYLAGYDKEDRVIPVIEKLKEVQDTPKNEVRFISRFPFLDKLIRGFEGGQLIIIAGITGHGKSVLSKSLTKSFAGQNIGVIWFSFEENFEQLVERLPNVPFFVPRELISNKMEWIKERIWEAKIKYDIRAVFIDNLHFLFDLLPTGNSNVSLAIGQIVRALKTEALKHNIVIFLMAHVNQWTLQKGGELDLGSMRDSSLIGAEADKVFLLWRKVVNGEGENTIIKVAKDRQTGTMGKKVELMMVDGLFLEASHEFDKITSQAELPINITDDIPL